MGDGLLAIFLPARDLPESALQACLAVHPIATEEPPLTYAALGGVSSGEMPIRGVDHERGDFSLEEEPVEIGLVLERFAAPGTIHIDDWTLLLSRLGAMVKAEVLCGVLGITEPTCAFRMIGVESQSCSRKMDRP